VCFFQNAPNNHNGNHVDKPDNLIFKSTLKEEIEILLFLTRLNQIGLLKFLIFWFNTMSTSPFDFSLYGGGGGFPTGWGNSLHKNPSFSHLKN